MLCSMLRLPWGCVTFLLFLHLVHELLNSPHSLPSGTRFPSLCSLSLATEISCSCTRWFVLCLLFPSFGSLLSTETTSSHLAGPGLSAPGRFSLINLWRYIGKMSVSYSIMQWELLSAHCYSWIQTYTASLPPWEPHVKIKYDVMDGG